MKGGQSWIVIRKAALYNIFSHSTDKIIVFMFIIILYRPAHFGML